ncbi:MAG TPA: YigZ family protein, partial [Candidatus Faecisoma merdavium]|nr:YigZ family protein [Candidatus Faecisoma merdavium]
EVKKIYKDATHYCYAYILDNFEKASDDGEPSGTAGLPILNVLKKENLNHVLCIVIRYFGGIKLGAGGLIRAYSNATKESIITKKYNKGYLIKVDITYNNIKQIEYQLNNSIIIEKNFNENPYYVVKITKEELNKLKIKYNIIKEIYVEEL